VINVADALKHEATRAPSKAAIVITRRRRATATLDAQSIDYQTLDARVDRLARALDAFGLGHGVRSVLMVKPSFDFFALMFALLRAGAVPVLIDPGIDRRALKTCIAEAEPTGFIGIPIAHLARLALGWGRGKIKKTVMVGRVPGLANTTLAALEQSVDSARSLKPVSAQDPAAILFTSGSTGIPKGVVYRHAHFCAQVELIRSAYAIEPGDIDCPTFPPFALFDPALGMTAVIPDMDFTRPGSVEPDNVLGLIEQFNVTQMFGSPALLDAVSRGAKNRSFPTVKRVLSAGAPVREDIARRFADLLAPSAPIHTPYGATECLPVATISHFELQETWALTRAGAGVCVGRPLAQNRVRIIAIRDHAIAAWADAIELPHGQIGEITVNGPSTTDTYFGRPQATALAKIRDGDAIVHRMGDVGYLDSLGRLWYCGRKSHRVETANGPHYTEQVEAIFNTHPAVRRSALVGLGERGQQTLLVYVELHDPSVIKRFDALRAELLTLAKSAAVSAMIQRIEPHPGFPVDIRHNAKIGREKLRDEAMRRWT
jgi:olefin beta-lactone synthetase